jgi:quinol monooxygenase YgiN
VARLPVDSEESEGGTMALGVSARWLAREGAEDKVLEILQKLGPCVAAEPGCRYYQAHRDPTNPRLFYLSQQYDDAAAFEAHLEREHVLRWGLPGKGEVDQYLEHREHQKYETLDF